MDDRLQHIKARLPGDVRLTSNRHPLVGKLVRAEKAHRWNGDIWLVVMLPDGFPARVRASETDLIGMSDLEQSDTASLSLEGIRVLREAIGRLKSRRAVEDER